MNNRYICRGKRKDNDEWIEGVAILQITRHLFSIMQKLNLLKDLTKIG